MCGSRDCDHDPDSTEKCPDCRHDSIAEGLRTQIHELTEDFLTVQAAEAVHLGKVGKYVVLAVKIDN